MIEPFTSRSGHASIRVDGIALHSPYDPVREAERFAETSLPAETPSLILLLGEGLGYASAAVSARFAAARVVPVYYSEDLYKASSFPSDEAWHPGLGIGLPEWSRSIIGEMYVEGLRVLEWPPSGRIFKRISDIAQRSVQAAVQEASGSFMTTVASGKLWLRNAVLNFISLDSVMTGDLCPAHAPVLIAAPGPSIQDVLPVIREKRGSFALWALPSGLAALEAAGIFPDLVVMTDPGHWSSSHLYFRRFSCPVAMPFSAARVPHEPARPVFPLLQPMFFEEEILRRAGVSATRIPPHGTVTATALDLALDSTDGRVGIAGADLCTKDIVSHARPNTFDDLHRISETRVSPHHSGCYLAAVRQPAESFTEAGAGRIRIPLPLKTYAGWLSSHVNARARDVFRVAPSSVKLESMSPVPPESLRGLPEAPGAGPQLRPVPRYPERRQRLSIAAELLDDWSRTAAHGLQKIKSGSDPTIIAADSALFRLAYYVETQSLMEIRRKLRLGGIRAAQDTAVELLMNLGEFLRFVRSKAGV